MRTLFAAVVSLALITPASGQMPTPCGDRAKLLEILADKYHETPKAIGLLKSGWLLELIMSEDGSTFTLMRSNVNGQSCLVGAGENWTTKLPVPVLIPGDDS